MSRSTATLLIPQMLGECDCIIISFIIGRVAGPNVVTIILRWCQSLTLLFHVERITSGRYEASNNALEVDANAIGHSLTATTTMRCEQKENAANGLIWCP